MSRPDAATAVDLGRFHRGKRAGKRRDWGDVRWKVRRGVLEGRPNVPPKLLDEVLDAVMVWLQTDWTANPSSLGGAGDRNFNYAVRAGRQRATKLLDRRQGRFERDADADPAPIFEDDSRLALWLTRGVELLDESASRRVAVREMLVRELDDAELLVIFVRYFLGAALRDLPAVGVPRATGADRERRALALLRQVARPEDF